ncbi:hypothetical protein CEE37_10125 [candidate division LCP-89 bacterium B3_LCP]|uniref:DUF433 domain-containing protein n=1 Tax=candidate division LCP-89 bacterium B3_LCP TaxID=2012998 RepID=A0A532UYQ1_UNCL8|nr:MAG: hypothetical protein CEE37_10125 [candidate division LCP-89 bacterium B3_LCP]
MTMQDYKYLGKGMYSMNEASILTGVSWAKVRHWIRGDLRTDVGNRNRNEPIIDLDFGKVDGIYLLSFLDMIEVLMIDQFLKEGVSIHLVRRVHSEAKKIFETKHPFALSRYWTDGRQILADIETETKDPSLLNLKRNQFELRNVTLMFNKAIEVTADDVAKCWWPLDKENPIVIDPGRCYGQPIVSNEGVPTIVLASAVRAEQSIEKVAHWYEVHPEAVQIAYDYEVNHTKRLAA